MHKDVGFDCKEQLTQLGAEKLAQALVELADVNDTASDIVARLLATPSKNMSRFQKKLSELKKRRHYYNWREASTFVMKLYSMLEDIKSAAKHPKEGVDMLLQLFDADSDCFEQCDDSGGDVGSFFRFSAAPLFVAYAKECDDKVWIAEQIFRSVQNDNYGVRDILLDHMVDCVPEELIRTTVDHLLSVETTDEYEQRIRYCHAEQLARQLKDAPLYEELRQKNWQHLNAAAWVDIARVYYESGDPETALERLGRIAPDDNFHAYERDRLLTEIYEATGDKERLTMLLKNNLRKHHSIHTLNELLDVIGNEYRDAVVEEEMACIMQQPELSYTDLNFLTETGHLPEAESYLLERSVQLDGDRYELLQGVAKRFEKENRFLPSSLIYRAMLNSILDRGYSKAYFYAAGYLKKIDEMALEIEDWQSQVDHGQFKTALSEKHNRKRAFWAKYNNP